ncbi:MAG: hypothetical protein WD036_02590 [Bauldia sp.]
MSAARSTMLAAAFSLTVAVGLAAASVYATDPAGLAAKSDRLPVIVAAGRYVTTETRGDGLSVLQRIRID